VSSRTGYTIIAKEREGKPGGGKRIEIRPNEPEEHIKVYGSLLRKKEKQTLGGRGRKNSRLVGMVKGGGLKEEDHGGLGLRRCVTGITRRRSGARPYSGDRTFPKRCSWDVLRGTRLT